VLDRNFGPFQIKVVDHHFGPSKIMVGDRYFGPSKVTVVDRNFGQIFFRSSFLFLSVNLDQCPLRQSKTTLVGSNF
jgi:hypothetical protein